MLQTVQNGNREYRDSTEEQNGYGYGVEDPIIKIGPRGHLWSYGGKCWIVPKKFEVPKKMRMRRGWELWHQGLNTPDNKKIYLFRELTFATVPPYCLYKMKIE